MSTLTFVITQAGRDISITITTREEAGRAPAPVLVPEIAQTVDLSRSSFIASATYNEAAHTLDVRMKRGGVVYRYEGVPTFVFDSFIKAESVGTFYTYNIKGQFACQPLKGEE